MSKTSNSAPNSARQINGHRNARRKVPLISFSEMEKNPMYRMLKNFNQYNMYVLDKPMVPKYSQITTSHKSSSSSLASRSLAPSTASTGISAPSASLTAAQRRKTLTKQKKIESIERVKKSNPRQYSADSGYESPRVASVHSHFELPPRVTTYMESECYLANLPRCDQFIAHLCRTLKPLISDLKFTKKRARDEINEFAKVLHRLAQESVISFPRSTKIVNTSPRFQEFLRISVENVVVQLVHERVFPVICLLSKREDRELSSCLRFLRESGLSADQLGLPEDFCIPLSAAIVELSALDMKTTPLDRMTCMYDSIEQIGNHIRHAIVEARGEDETGSVLRLDDLPYPNDAELIMLLATVIIHARPKHLMATLNYADVFAWSVPADMIECVKLIQSAVDLLRNVQPEKLPPTSGKLKRDVSMEEIIQLADEFEQSFDRQGNRLEPVKSALDMHREKFTLRLELSSEEKNRKQEEAWALLDRCRSPLNESGRFKRGFLARVHDKLICSTDSVEIVDE
ncbi:uncharacterized protein [Lepeophtheirus salmonis]|uniref:uncharacterized protein isoform X2 n=1 Tax=Lepeophtheirus salmonis TaxID=72036 RepID=UPI001AE227D3|nr:uncharacterized protein LOC121128007 isoform X2 [Lepeophtheirus salmonis]